MDLGLGGKAAAVMAASEGLGKAAAWALAREGANVAICARRAGPLAKTAKEIAAATGVTVVPVEADVTKTADVERFVNAAANELLGLDVLVTNSGGPPASRFEDLRDADWQHAFDLTVMSVVRALRFALPHLRAQGAGSVVCIQSTSVKEPIDGLVLSNGLRPGVMGLVKTLGRELAPDVRVNAVLPGYAATARVHALATLRAQEEDRTADDVMAERAAGIPLGRIADPMDVGNAVAFLASDAARHLTGTSISVDGGAVRSIL